MTQGFKSEGSLIFKKCVLQIKLGCECWLVLRFHVGSYSILFSYFYLRVSHPGVKLFTEAENGEKKRRRRKKTNGGENWEDSLSLYGVLLAQDFSFFIRRQHPVSFFSGLKWARIQVKQCSLRRGSASSGGHLPRNNQKHLFLFLCCECLHYRLTTSRGSRLFRW